MVPASPRRRWSALLCSFALLLGSFAIATGLVLASGSPAAAAPDTSGDVAPIYAITQLNSVPSATTFNDAWISPSGQYALTDVYGGNGENVFYQISGDTASDPYGLLPSNFVVNFNPYNLNDLGQVGGSVNGQPAIWSQGQVSTYSVSSFGPDATGSINEISPGGVGVGTVGWDGTPSQNGGYEGVVETDGNGLALMCSFFVPNNVNNPFPDGACNPDSYGDDLGVPQYLPNDRYLPDTTTPNPPTVGSCGSFQPTGANGPGTIVGRTAFFDCGAIVWNPATGSQLLTNLLGNANWALDNAWDIANDGTIIGSGTNARGQAFMYLATPAEVPTIDSIEPASGSYKGGTTFTITGSGFEANPASGYVGPGPTTIYFNGTAVTQFQCLTTTTCTGVSPPGTGVASVTVSTNVGDSVGSASFTYIGPPFVTSISPDESPITGNQPIQIFGSGFNDATNVLFELPGGSVSVPVASGDIQNDGEIDIATPNVSSLITGGVDSVQAHVVVSNAEGSSIPGVADLFTFGSPDITEVSPDIGPAVGNTTLTISGSGFTADTTFFFYLNNAYYADTVVSVSADGTSATVTTPDVTGSIGSASSDTVDTYATNNGGTSAQSSVDQYTFAQTAVNKVAPSAGSIAGGTTITISGYGFTGATSVEFQEGSCTQGDSDYTGQTPPGVSVSSANFLSSSDTSITLVTPDDGTALSDYQSNAGACGSSGLPTDVIVELPNNVASPVVASDLYVEEVPHVAAVTPNSGSVTGNTTIQITGSGFSGADTVTFVDGCGDAPVPATSFNVVSDTLISAVTPNDASQYTSCGSVVLPTDVIVTVPDAAVGGDIASVAQSLDQYTFDNYPEVTQVFDDATNASSAPITGGDDLTIKGTALTGATEVNFYLPSDPSTPVYTISGSALNVFDDNDIFVSGPDLASLAGDIPTGQSGLTLGVSVAIPDSSGEGGFTDSPITANSQFTFNLPQVTSVVDTTTTTNSGPLIGQDTIVVTGTGFNVTNGSVALQLNVNGATLWQSTSADYLQVNAAGTTITFTAPSLTAFNNMITSGQPGLVTDVVVEVYDGQGSKVISPTQSSDQFTFTVPIIYSVTNPSGSTNAGPISGGEYVTIKGANLSTPGSINDVVVTLTDADGKSVTTDSQTGEMNLVSNSEIQVLLPSAYAQMSPDITPGSSGEYTNVQIEFETTNGNEFSPISVPDDQFYLNVPVVTSVVDSNTNTNAGPITGGGFVQVNGSNLEPPSNTTDVEVIFTDTHGNSVTIDETTSVFVQNGQQINLTLPNSLAQLGGDVPPGGTGVSTDVQVVFVTPSGNVISALNAPADQFTFDVLNFTSPTTANFEVGQSGSFDVTTTAINAGGAPVTLGESGALPDGVTFTDNGNGTATLAGTPVAGSGSEYVLTITATGGGGPPVTQSLDLIVGEAPTITSADSATFTAGTAGTFQVTTNGYGTGVDPDAGLSETGALPPGVTFTDNGDGTATISGTPSGTGGIFDFTINATNGVTPDASQDFELTVLASPTFTSSDIANFSTQGSLTQVFNITAVGYGSDPDPSDMVISLSGTLPQGLYFTDNGDGTASISGTPAANSGGDYDVTLTADNGVSPNTVQDLSIDVAAPPTITSADATIFTVGTAGSFQVTTTGGSAANAIALSESGSLPSGVTFSDNGDGTATISGTPTGFGQIYDFTITASNGVMPDATQDFELTLLSPPTFTSTDSTTFNALGAPVQTFNITAVGYGTDNDPNDMSISESGNLPAGVYFSDNGDGTATLSGNPGPNSGGDYDITFTAANGASPSTVQDFTLSVSEAPTITSADATNFTVNTSGTFQVTTTGGSSADPMALSETGSLPDGLTFADNGDGTATISGTPDDDTSGQYVLTITASNSVTPDATQDLVLTVLQPPTFTSTDSTTFDALGAPMQTFNITANGYGAGVNPAAMTITESGNLPAGVYFSNNGDGTATLSGNPGANSGGDYDITFTATNGVSPDATQSFILSVAEAPAITSAASTNFVVNTLGAFQVTTTGGSSADPVALSETGSLPDGLTFADNGDGTATISGTPDDDTSGQYVLAVTASNGVTPDATQDLTLNVAAPLSITSANSATFLVGQSNSFGVTVDGADTSHGSVTTTITESGALPGGVTFVDNGDGTATLSGTPAAGSTNQYDITITASNGVTPDATQSFTLNVQAPPTFTSSSSTNFTVNQPGSFAVTATGLAGGGDPAAMTLTESGALPDGVTFVDNGDGSATLSGTPSSDAGGEYEFTITASNGVSPDATQDFDLVVFQPPSITSPDTTNFTEGLAGTFAVTTTGTDGLVGYGGTNMTLTESGALPDGVTFVDNGDGTATISGTPDAGSNNQYDITITASNGVDPDATQDFVLTVLSGLSITSTDTTNFTVGLDGPAFDVTTDGWANGETPALTESGALPDGVTFVDNGDGTATISGTPDAGTSGDYDITITASNGVDPDATQDFVLTVLSGLSITSTDTTNFTVGLDGPAFDVTTDGWANGETPALTESGALPDGVTFVDNGDGTATISGTPDAGTSGDYDITITASNGVDPDATQDFVLTVLSGLSITSTDTTNFTVGLDGPAFDVTTDGWANGETPALTESGALPDGVTFVDNGDGTATISGTPDAGTSGDYDITITASNGVDPDATQDFVLTVLSGLSITSTDTTNFTVGLDGPAFDVTTDGWANGETPALTESGALPDGVTFVDNGDGTATISGTPDAGTSGDYDITITASNGVDPDATQDFVLTVLSGLSITSTDTTNFTVGLDGPAFDVTTDGWANGETPALTESGALPDGVTFVDNGDGTATISGTPDAGTSGDYDITITASNGVDPDATQDFVLTVLSGLSITSTDTTNFTVGLDGPAFDVTTDGWANGETPALTESGALPDGVTFVDNGDGTATISGTPDAGTSGDYDITITASNGVDPDATQDFVLTVLSGLSITSTDTTNFTVGLDGPAFDVTTDGWANGETPALTESGALPDGVTFVDNGDGTATISGTPDAGTSGDYDITITASNGVDPDATQDFTLDVVSGDPSAPQNVVAQAGVDSAVITWAAPTNDGGSTILTYTVTASSGGQSKTVDVPTTQATISGLNAGTAYTFSVVATNANGAGPDAVSNAVVPTSSAVEDATSVTSTSPTGSASTPVITSPDGPTMSATGDGEGVLEAGTYASDPVPAAADGSGYFDVSEAPGSSFTTITVQICGVSATSTIEWWNPNTQTWQEVSGQSAPTGVPVCITVTVNAISSPDFTEFYGTVLAVVNPPQVTPSTLVSVPVGASINDQLHASGGSGTLHFSATGLPGWLTLSSSGRLSGTAPDDVTTVNFFVSVTDSTNATSLPVEFSLTVVPGTTRVSIEPDPAPSVKAGAVVTYSATVTEKTGTGPLSGTVTFTEDGVAVPSCTDLSLVDGVVSCAVTFSVSGRFTIGATYGADPNFSGSSGSVSQSVSSTSSKPVITSAPTTSAVVGASFSFVVTATGSPTPTFSESGALPKGVSVVANANGTATLAGTPAAGSGASYKLTITATNAAGSTTQHFVLVVDQAAAFTSPSSDSVKVGKSFSFTFKSSGYPTATLSESGALPNGVSFVANANGTATLSGTPAAGSAASYSLTITATNGIGSPAVQTFVLSVATPPVITSAPTTSAVVGASFSFVVTATGSPTPTFSESGALPKGVSVVANANGTATLAGTPAAGSGASYKLTITATNAAGSTTQHFVLVVDQAAAFTSPSSDSVKVGKSFSFTFKSSGYPTATLSESGALPNGVSFVANANGTATLSGTPAPGSAASYSLTITATNGIGSPVVQTFVLSVATT